MSRRQVRANQEANKQVKKKKIIAVIMILVLVGVLYGLFSWAYSKISGMMINVQPVKIGRLEKIVRCRAVVINHEFVANAPGNGRFENLLREGEKVRKGGLVGYFYRTDTNEPEKMWAPYSGVVCYHPDVRENWLQGLGLSSSAEQILKYTPEPVNDGSFEYQAGQPVFRIIDNLVPTRLVVEMESKQAKKQGLDQKNRVLIRYRDQELSKARFESVSENGEKLLAFLSFNQFQDALLETRRPLLDCVVDRGEGLVVPTNAIVKKGNKTGVFYLHEELYQFKTVQIVFMQDDLAIVKGVDEGERVVTTPSLVQEGMPYE
ncbi:MAG: HlyD family efflux transporter periplasmic adaptor subunit [Acidobacteriota bacterium]